MLRPLIAPLLSTLIAAASTGNPSQDATDAAGGSGGEPYGGAFASNVTNTTGGVEPDTDEPGHASRLDEPSAEPIQRP